MKKILILYLTALLAFAARAGNVVSVTGGSGHPGDEVTLTVSLANTDAVSAVELSIPLGGTASLVAQSAQLSSRANGHVISAAMAGDVLRIYIYSLSLTTLNGSEGELCSVRLRLSDQPGTCTLQPAVMLSDAQGQRLEATATGGQLTVLAPDLQLVTISVDFGRVPIRGTYTKNVQVRNTGNEPATISEVQFDDTDFSVDQLPITVAAGATQNVTVAYRPINRSPGVKSWMTIISDATSGKKKLYVNAIPFSVNELHVLRTEGIANTEAEVQLRVNNMEPLVGMQCTFTLPAQLDYVDGSVAVADRAAGCMAFARCEGRMVTLYVYSPTNTPWQGDDGVVATFRVLLNGTSGNYRLNPTNVVLSNVEQENMTSATESNYVVIRSPRFNGATTLNMGLTPMPEVAQATYTIRNTGQTPLTIDRVVFLADGYEVTEQLPITIPNGQNRTLTVRYLPETEGAFAATMNIYTDDPTARMVPVKLSGEKFAPNTLAVTAEKETDGIALHFALDNWSTNLTAIQFDMEWPAAVTYASATTTSRLAGHQVAMLPLGAGQWRVLVYSMSNAAIGGTDGELFTLHFTCNGVKDYQRTTVSIDGITVSDVRSVNKYSGTDLAYAIPFLYADVNEDYRVDVLDVNDAVNCILERDMRWADNADLDGDGFVSVIDLNDVINAILQQ